MSQRHLIKFCIVGFPCGLIVLGAISFFFHFNKSQAKERALVSGLRRAAISESDLKAHVKTLAEKVGERHVGKFENLRRAEKYISSTMGPRNMGYDLELQTFEGGGRECSNIIAELPGARRKGEIIVVGAHYDSVANTPAANDNATGVAALMALARAFTGTRNERTLRFVAFVNEEPPFFQTDQMGSLVYAKRCKARKENIFAMLSLESMGYYSDEPKSQQYPAALAAFYPTTGNFIAVVGNQSSKRLVERITGLFEKSSNFPIVGDAFPAIVPGVGWSDHWSFWQVGYSGVMVTDTATFRYPHYHKPEDTVDKIDFESFHQVVLGLNAVIEHLANPSTAPKTKPKRSSVNSSLPPRR